MLMLIGRNARFAGGLEVISIHLMLMLILIYAVLILNSAYFNTSHVNVNLLDVDNIIFEEFNFNTSHVNVNRILSSDTRLPTL